MFRRNIIGISGPCGSGKSTFAKLLAKELNISILEEPIPFDALNEFNNNKIKNSFVLQKAFIQGKLDGMKKYSENRNIIFDRTVEEDREIFLKLHYSLGFLTLSELEELTNFSTLAEQQIGRANIKIILMANIETLNARIEADKEHLRPQWLKESIAMQLSLYKSWISCTQENIVVINTSEKKLKEMKKLVKDIASKLKENYD